MRFLIGEGLQSLLKAQGTCIGRPTGEEESFRESSGGLFVEP